MPNYVYLSMFVVMLAIGQFFFKKVGLAIKGLHLSDGITVAAAMPALYFGLALYGLATMFWIWILSRIPLSQAYPWVGVAAILVPVLGMVAFGERVTPTFWVGAIFIAIGMSLIQYGASAT